MVDGLDERLGETLSEPLTAALLRFLDAVNEDPEARRALSELLGYLVTVASDHDAFQNVLYALAESLMLLEDDRNLVPLMRALCGGVAPDVDEVLAGADPALDVEGGPLWDALDLIRDVQAIDDGRVLRQILQNAVAIPETGEEITPLETIVDVLAEVNRARPGEGTSLRAEDYAAVLEQTTEFVRDEDRGLERLNAVVQQRDCFPERGRACAVTGQVIESEGLCYPGATCECVETDGARAWRCERP